MEPTVKQGDIIRFIRSWMNVWKENMPNTAYEELDLWLQRNVEHNKKDSVMRKIVRFFMCKILKKHKIDSFNIIVTNGIPLHSWKCNRCGKAHVA